MKRFLGWILVLALLLSACGREDTAQTGTMPEEISGAEYPFPDLDVTLSIPDSWLGRTEVRREENRVTVTVDGEAIYVVAVLENTPDVQQKEQALMDEGFIFLADNYIHCYYYRYLTALPKELYLEGVQGYSRGAFEHSEEKILASIHHKTEEEILTALWEGVGGDWTYTNYRTGMSFTIPERLRKRCSVVSGQYVHYLEGRIQDERYTLATFLAAPMDHHDVYIYVLGEVHVLYPELSMADGWLFGAFNRWQPPVSRPGVCGEDYSWSSISLYAKTVFSTKMVQEVVDSFHCFTKNRPDAYRPEDGMIFQINAAVPAQLQEDWLPAEWGQLESMPLTEEQTAELLPNELTHEDFTGEALCDPHTGFTAIRLTAYNPAYLEKYTICLYPASPDGEQTPFHNLQGITLYPQGEEYVCYQAQESRRTLLGDHEFYLYQWEDAHTGMVRLWGRYIREGMAVIICVEAPTKEESTAKLTLEAALMDSTRLKLPNMEQYSYRAWLVRQDTECTLT